MTPWKTGDMLRNKTKEGCVPLAADSRGPARELGSRPPATARTPGSLQAPGRDVGAPDVRSHPLAGAANMRKSRAKPEGFLEPAGRLLSVCCRMHIFFWETGCVWKGGARVISGVGEENVSCFRFQGLRSSPYLVQGTCQGPISSKVMEE